MYIENNENGYRLIRCKQTTRSQTVTKHMRNQKRIGKNEKESFYIPTISTFSINLFIILGNPDTPLLK